MKIFAYFEEWSRRPGESVRMAISTPLTEVTAELVRLTTGPGAAGQSHVGTEPVSEVPATRASGRLQDSPVGSYAQLPLENLDPREGVTVHCFIWPTLPAKGVQTIWALNHASGRVELVLSGGRLQLLADGVLVSSVMPVAPRRWYSVAAAVGGQDSALDVMSLQFHPEKRRDTTVGQGAAIGRLQSLMLASVGPDERRRAINCYNGKIDTPVLYRGLLSPAQCLALHEEGERPASPLAEWLIGGDWSSRAVRPCIPALADGELVNGVERGVTGRNWDGSSDSFIETPEQYCALQFHEDDMVDSGWSYDLEFTLPATLRSGVYAVRLSGGEDVEHYPLFVLGARDDTAPVLFLASTNTYLAYANDHLASLDYSQVMTHEMVVPDDEKLLFSEPAFGRSCYDTHSDGTPVRYSSRRRPMLNVRPGYPNWLTGSYRNFPQDLYIVEWLERSGMAFHVATDEELHREGMELLSKYKVIVTGSHPEYWTRNGLSVLDCYLQVGGRLMYLGGNGFYWVTSHDPERPWIIEVRRDNSGTRCWDAPYGERTHVASLEQGGIWKTRGRGPHATVGVGFSSEGWSKGSGYERLAASYEVPGAAFFKGVDSRLIGDYGHVLGGAAGDEVDRYDVSLGSPVHAHVLASSTPLGNEYQLVIEEQTLTLPEQGGQQKPQKIRADMVYFTTGNRGAVFSVGSMTYCGALAWNGFTNDVACVTTNVLRAFTSELPLS